MIADAYAHDISDEFVVPAVIGDYRGMRDGDGVLCFNFRADRVREILAALLDPAFAGFPRRRSIRFAAAVGMTQYSEQLDALLQTIFPPQSLAQRSGRGRRRRRPHAVAHGRDREISARHLFPQRRARKSAIRGEDRIMVPSPKVATYDLQPEMSAPELTDKAVEAIGSGKYDLIVLNYANPDMVGHTGSLPRRDQGGRDGRYRPRPHRRGDRAQPAARCWSPPTTAIAS